MNSFYKEFTKTDKENDLNIIEDNIFKKYFINSNDYLAPLKKYTLKDLKYEDPIRFIVKLIEPIKDIIINEIINKLNLNINEYDDNLRDNIYDHFCFSADRFNEMGLFNDIFINYAKIALHDNIKILENIPINEGVELDNFPQIDVHNRDGLFVYLDGKLEYTNDNNITHADLLNKIMNVEEFSFKRPTYSEITNITGQVPLAYGHIVDDIAFISETIGYSMHEVATVILQKLPVNKVFTEPSNNKTIRLAENNMKSYIEEANNQLANEISKTEVFVFNELFLNQRLGYEIFNNKKFNDVYQLSNEDILTILTTKFEDDIIDCMLDNLNINTDEFNEDLDFDIIEHFKTSPALLNDGKLIQTYIIQWATQKAHEEATILLDADVDIGRTLNLGPYASQIDIVNRDGIFVYLDGKIDYDTSGLLSHSQLLNKMFGIDEFDYQREDLQVVLKKLGLSDDTALAFGHIVDNIAFVDVCNNVNKLDVGKKALELPNIEKVFTVPYHGITTRLAKRI